MAILILLSISSFVFYFNNTSSINHKTLAFYATLKEKLKQKGYAPKLIVVSAKRFKWHNVFQVKVARAAPKSKHLTGDAIDFIVFDINNDGQSDNKDVNIVYRILDQEIISNKGGIGTYKTSSSFFYRQMIHIDCRGKWARWVE
jgi:uncharacterized protein YcbK (DUF882 family)